MQERFYRAKNSIITNLSKFILRYRVYLLVFFVIFLISFVTGICTCASYASDITCENLINKYLYSFLCRDLSYFSLFLIYSLYFALVALFIIFLTRNIFISVVDGILLALMAYIFGFDLCVIILSLGLSGIILGILVGGLLGIAIFCLIVLMISIATHRYRTQKRMCGDECDTKYWAIYLTIILIAMLIIFIGCLLFSIIHIFVIVD